MADLPPIDGDFIKKFRKDRGWSQSDLADYLGCSQTRISAFEHGAEVKKAYQKLIMSLLLAPPQSSARAMA